ncbi:MAG: F0F1 ATP synthase subunit alpha, partial [Planctomycetes bacterium]|nr:F0F1 ATP synthase subunit alpha [Planctomycetota bacterium]
LDLAAFRELEAFAQLGTELDRISQSQLDRGYRMVELLKQPQYQPMSVVDQIMSLYAGIHGYLDDVAPSEVRNWEREFLQFMHERKSEVPDRLAETKKLDDEAEQMLVSALKKFQAQQKSGAPTETTEPATAAV